MFLLSVLLLSYKFLFLIFSAIYRDSGLFCGVWKRKQVYDFFMRLPNLIIVSAGYVIATLSGFVSMDTLSKHHYGCILCTYLGLAHFKFKDSFSCHSTVFYDLVNHTQCPFNSFVLQV